MKVSKRCALIAILKKRETRLMQSGAEYKEDKPLEIPKKIHFIWIGRPIDPDDFKEIAKIASVAKMSGFEVNLWVDKTSNYTTTSAIEDIHIPSINIKNISTIYEKVKIDSFYKKNNLARTFMMYVEREQVGSKNLASASDLLRYEILRQEGGYYMDTDTIFKSKPDTVLITDKNDMGLKANLHCYFKINEFDNTYIITGYRINNDMIGSTPNHEVIENTILLALERYKELDDVNSTQPNNALAKQRLFHPKKMDLKRNQAPLSNNDNDVITEDRWALTLYAAGPHAFRTIINSYIEKYLEKRNHKKSALPYDLLCKLNDELGNENSNVGWRKKYIFGIEVIGRSRLRWFTQPDKNNKNKVYSFDDVSLLKKKNY